MEGKGPLKPEAEEDGKFRIRDWVTPSGLKKKWGIHKATVVGYGKIGGVGVAVYYILKSGFNIADFMAATSFYDVATVSFVAGNASMGAVAVVLAYASRLFTIRPELVYKQVFKRLQKDVRVNELLGGGLSAGKFRAYTLNPGGFAVLSEEGKSVDDYSGWERFWRPQKMQMMFQVSGKSDDAMVSFEGQKLLDGSMQFNSVVLDVMESGERVVLEGDGSIVIYQGKIKLR